MTAWLYQTQPTSHSKGGGALFKNSLLYVLVPTGGSFFCLMTLQCEFRRIFVRMFQFIAKLPDTLRRWPAAGHNPSACIRIFLPSALYSHIHLRSHTDIHP